MTVKLWILNSHDQKAREATFPFNEPLECLRLDLKS